MFDQWKAIWTNLSVRHRITICATVLIAAVAVYGLTHWQKERDFKPLYTGMSAEDAGSVVAKLKESGVEFRVSDDGSTVLAPSARQAELRLELATAGLPKTGRIGFELFDKANLGLTDFAEQVNYRRAVEGELERSVRAIAEVEQARVHITFPKDSVFLESRTPGKASVLLKLRRGAKLPAQNLTGISHMVASAVEGLTPESVAIMDIHGALLSRPKKSQDALDLSDEAIEYRHRVERDLLTKINSTLEPLLGADKFRAGVSVECDFTSGEQSEETYDPEKSVMTSSQKTEEVTIGPGSSAGVPGTASSLPRPTGRTSGGGGAGVSRRSETIAFQTSKTVRRTRIPQGTVQRISASVLVDQNVHWEGTGAQQKKVVTPPSAETVRAIKVLVTGVLGLQPDRGDQLVVETLPFELTLQTPPPEAAPQNVPVHSLKLPYGLEPWMVAAGAGGALVLGLGVLVALRKRRKSKAQVKTNLAVGAAPDGKTLPQGVETKGLPEGSGSPLHQLGPEAAKMDRLVGSVRSSVATDPALVAGVLRNWMEEL